MVRAERRALTPRLEATYRAGGGGGGGAGGGESSAQSVIQSELPPWES